MISCVTKMYILLIFLCLWNVSIAMQQLLYDDIPHTYPPIYAERNSDLPTLTFECENEKDLTFTKQNFEQREGHYLYRRYFTSDGDVRTTYISNEVTHATITSFIAGKKNIIHVVLHKVQHKSEGRYNVYCKKGGNPHSKRTIPVIVYSVGNASGIYFGNHVYDITFHFIITEFAHLTSIKTFYVIFYHDFTVEIEDIQDGLVTYKITMRLPKPQHKYDITMEYHHYEELLKIDIGDEFLIEKRVSTTIPTEDTYSDEEDTYPDEEDSYSGEVIDELV